MKRQKLSQNQISDILSMKRRGASNVEIGKAFSISEAAVRYHLKKRKASDTDAMKGGGALKMLQMSALRQGLDKALSKLNNALNHCSNDNEDTKLVLDIAKFYIMAMRFEQVGDDEPPTTSAEQFEIDEFVLGLVPKKLHAKAADEIIAIQQKHRKLEDSGGLIQ